MPDLIPRPPTPTGSGHCKYCLRDVLWTITAANRVPQAVDPTPDPSGKVAVYRDDLGRWRSRQLSRERPTAEHLEVLHIAHAATCPQPSRKRPAPRARPGRRWPVVPYGRRPR